MFDVKNVQYQNVSISTLVSYLLELLCMFVYCYSGRVQPFREDSLLNRLSHIIYNIRVGLLSNHIHSSRNGSSQGN